MLHTESRADRRSFDPVPLGVGGRVRDRSVAHAPEPSPGKRLSILHVTRQFLPNCGGLEDFVANLAREQIGLGHDVRVVTLDRLFARPDLRLPARERIDGIAVERVPFRGSTRYPLAPAVLARLGGADLVHVHAIDFFFDALALTKPIHRKPLVATTHGGFFHTPAHAALKRVWFHGPTRLACRAYGAVACVSANDARQFAAITSKEIPVVEPGVDLAKFVGAASRATVRTLLTLGRFAHNKRLDRLIETLRALRSDGQDWRLMIVGAPSDLSVEDLRTRIEAAGVADAVSVHAGLDAEGVRSLIGKASLFVSASEYEGFGIALIEAMSAGLVPVVHPNGSFVDLAARHQSIALCDFSDPGAAARAVRRAHTDLASNGRPTEENLSGYTWAGVAACYFDIYLNALSVSSLRANKKLRLR